VLENHASIYQLIQNLTNDPNCLNDVRTINNAGQSRRISKTAIKNIIKFIVPATPEPAMDVVSTDV